MRSTDTIWGKLLNVGGEKEEVPLMLSKGTCTVIEEALSLLLKCLSRFLSQVE